MKIFITINKFIAIILLLSINSVISYGQQISVMHFAGDAYTYNTDDSKVKYNKIVFGPLPNADKILVKENATLKLLNEENEVCEVTEEGEYDIKTLKFVKGKSNSLFNKFCDYFHSFFINHSSSESKSNYKNSIHAISRGALSPPQLDFPIDGFLPATSGNMDFSWSHSCEACQYVVTIYDLETRASVYAWTTVEHKVTLENVDQFLLPNKKYYWTVTISGQEMEYPISRITVGEKGDYDTHISNLNKEILQSQLNLDVATKAIYIMSYLAEQDLMNYAIYYGQQQTEMNDENKILADFVERFWYDALTE